MTPRGTVPRGLTDDDDEGDDEVGARAPKPKRLSAKRKVFLEAASIVERASKSDGDIDYLATARKLLPLLNKAPRSGWLAEEWAICSALYAVQTASIGFDQSAEEVHEHCVGGQMFLVAFLLGRQSVEHYP